MGMGYGMGPPMGYGGYSPQGGYGGYPPQGGYGAPQGYGGYGLPQQPGYAAPAAPEAAGGNPYAQWGTAGLAGGEGAAPAGTSAGGEVAAPVAGAAGGEAQLDYSAQWAEYYGPLPAPPDRTSTRRTHHNGHNWLRTCIGP
jgi:annexin A7/11